MLSTSGFVVIVADYDESHPIVIEYSSMKRGGSRRERKSIKMIEQQLDILDICHLNKLRYICDIEET